MKSYNEILEDLKIKEDGEDFVGERINIENFFLQMIKYEIDQNDLDIEEILYDIEITLDLLQDLNGSGLDPREMVIVKYNPMGAYYFEKYEEE